MSRTITWIATWARIAVAFTLICAGAIVYLTLSALLLPWRTLRIRIGNVYGKTVGRLAVRILGTRVRVRNGERLADATPAIYLTNHTSTLDVLIGMWLCPMGGCGIAKKEVARIPFFGWAYLLSGHLLIDRGNRQGAIEALSETADLVRRNGLSIWIWPEGTRSRDGRLLPFKKGFVHMAIATGLPVVPVVLHGAHDRVPSRSFTVRPGAVEVDVLPAIDTRGWKPESVEEHVESVHACFRQVLGEA